MPGFKHCLSYLYQPQSFFSLASLFSPCNWSFLQCSVLPCRLLPLCRFTWLNLHLQLSLPGGSFPDKISSSDRSFIALATFLSIYAWCNFPSCKKLCDSLINIFLLWPHTLLPAKFYAVRLLFSLFSPAPKSINTGKWRTLGRVGVWRLEGSNQIYSSCRVLEGSE
jgi:hypothetical protein